MAFTRSAQNLRFSKIRLDEGKLAWKRSFCGVWAFTGGDGAITSKARPATRVANA